MHEQSEQYNNINLIIAADFRCGEIKADDDQIWELNISRGEPPAIGLHTTYGLRAYGMRLFPKFSYQSIPYSDPHSFSLRPSISFSAPNFVTLNYSPFSSLDVLQRVWVPDSQTLVGQVTLANTTTSLLQFVMEWVVQLNPLQTGSPMSATQISVNTVLQGQSGHLHPVFFLTGGPRSDYSALPSLGAEVSLGPKSKQQFSWALAALDSPSASFYSARKSTACSLENEQIKITMLQKQEMINIESSKPKIDNLFQQSQRRLMQLILPSFREISHPFYVCERNPEQGYLSTDTSKKYEQEWGIQRTTEIWVLSRMLLPARPDLLKGLLQNLIEQQGSDGTIFAQTGWHGHITGLPAAPLVCSMALETFHYTMDLEWLTQISPSLVRSLKVWFEAKNDEDGDGWPEWHHLMQTGILESAAFSRDKKNELQALVESAEWPSLAALLIKDCQSMKTIAELTEDQAESPWLDDRIEQLSNFIRQSWDEKSGTFRFRDCQSHNCSPGKKLHVFKQNGKAALNFTFPETTRIYVTFTPQDGKFRPVEIRIKGVINHYEKTITLAGRELQWQDEYSFAVTEEHFSFLKEISVSGVKKGDVVEIRSVDFFFKGPDFIIPLWAGLASKEQVQRMVELSTEFVHSNRNEIPLFIKIMWIEGLLKNGFKESACHYFADWFFGETCTKSNPKDLTQPDTKPKPINLSTASLHDLLPVGTFLKLLGVEKITAEELLLEGFNEFFPKVNVQYKKFLLELESSQTRVSNINGENLLITDPGPHQISLS